jgi:pyruvate kinase
MRRTKIIATMGPALMQEDCLRAIADEVDLVRFNASHGTLEERKKAIKALRAMMKENGRVVGFLLDLQGPKIRIGRFLTGSVSLKEGASFALNTAGDPHAGDERGVFLEYAELPQQVCPGDELLLDDGRITLTVQSISGSVVHCVVLLGGLLSDHKGLNKKGGGLSAAALTAKDKEDIIFAAEYHMDYIAVSFLRTAEDLNEARFLLTQAGGTAGIVAKIERREAMDHLDSVISAADAVMVARGDLGVECGFAELPAMQRQIINTANEYDKTVIVATQMMESMIHSPIPTRAEVSDVAHAVLEGADAVMLSAETASGAYPVETVHTMATICVSAEKRKAHRVSRERWSFPCHGMQEAMAMAAVYISHHLELSAILSLTHSGATPLWMSRMRVPIPIFAFSKNTVTQGRLSLMKGVWPVMWEGEDPLHYTLKQKWVREEDSILVTAGDALRIIDIKNYQGDIPLWP